MFVTFLGMNSPALVKLKRTKQIIGIVIGALLLLLSPIIARWQYTIGMQQAFNTIESGYHSSLSNADPHQLSGNIDSVLHACAGGLLGSVVGLLVLVVSIILYRRAGLRPFGKT